MEHESRESRAASSRRQIRRSARSTEPPRARIGWIIGLLVVPAVLVAGLIVLTTRPSSPSLSSALPTGPLLGSSAASTTQLTQFSSHFGHMPIVRVYYPGLPSANAWTGSGKAGANHSAVIVSFKAQPSAILSGADDNTLKFFFDSAPATHPIYYSYYHEPEDNIAAGQFSLADYKAAWAHVAALAKAAHNPQLHSTLILMAYDLDKSSGRNWRDYLPSGGIISTLGWDAYPAGAISGKDVKLTPPATFMGPAIAASRSVGLPFGFAEFNVPDIPGRPGWLTDVGNYVMNSGALFGTLFEGNGSQISDSPSIAAWHAEVQASALHSLPPSAPPTSAPAPTRSASPRPTASATTTAAPTTPPATSPPASPAPTAPAAGCAPASYPAPGPGGPQVTGLTASPRHLVISGQNHVRIRFILGQAANVTVCVHSSGGKVARRISRPGRHAGAITVSYYGYDGAGHRLPAGRYRITVVAGNSQASDVASAPLVLTSP